MPDFLSTAADIARSAGKLLLPYYDRRVRVEYKGHVDIVTEADLASEKFIVERLRTLFPEHGILAEESGERRSESPYRWYIDPLDGTTNFAHGFPTFCVSVGLEKSGELLAGAVYDPLRDELFTAEKGAGAMLNGRRMRVSGVAALSEALVATGFAPGARHKRLNIFFYEELTRRSHGVRRAGSAALDLCYVACGRLDGFWEFNLNPWDVAAGSLLVREAGGRVTDMQGAAHALTSGTILASNGAIHAGMLQAFAEVFQAH
jgi:myo-inositol-1(or 4)-monophosphatase